MLAALARSYMLPEIRLPKWQRPSTAAFYAAIAVLTISIALGSTFQIRSRLQHSHLIEAHFSRMVENTHAVPLPGHFPVFVAATSSGKIEFLGLSICNLTSYRLGERVPLWLDPTNPRVVTPNHVLDIWFFPLLMVFAATGFSVFALLAQKPKKPDCAAGHNCH